jgi:hypothetical protein
MKAEEPRSPSRAICWAIAIGACLCVLTGGSGARGAAAAPSPLPRAVFRSGHLGHFQWGAAVEAPEEVEEREGGAICLDISMVEPLPGGRAEGSDLADCGPPPARQPVLLEMVGGRNARLRTAIGVLFPPTVRRVALKLKGVSLRFYPAQQLDMASLSGISDEPLAAFAHGFLGRPCIVQLRGYSAKGAVVSRLGQQRCAR